MDKFGIFNLLNSFLGFANEKKESENGVSSPAPRYSTPDVPTEKPKFLPLQQGMLSVMRSHDEFVKRVREKNELNEKNANKPK